MYTVIYTGEFSSRTKDEILLFINFIGNELTLDTIKSICDKVLDLTAPTFDAYDYIINDNQLKDAFRMMLHLI